MDWLQNNWIWIALVVGFLAMRRFGLGGCGHHSGHRHHETSSSSDGGRSSVADAPAEKELSPAAHAHSGGSVPPVANSNPAVDGPARAKPHRHGC